MVDLRTFRVVPALACVMIAALAGGCSTPCKYLVGAEYNSCVYRYQQAGQRDHALENLPLEKNPRQQEQMRQLYERQQQMQREQLRQFAPQPVCTKDSFGMVRCDRPK